MPKNNPSESIQKYIKILKTAFFICGLFFCGNIASAAALNLPKDNEGWTIFTPSDDSRIMYVSADGNDSTGAIYDDDDAVLGGNPFNPTGSINSFGTYAAAFANTRDGYPDWVLFKRGDVFDEVIGSQVRSGRSISEPFLVGSYGSSGLSPVLHVTSISGINPTHNKQWFALMGVTFYSPTRDPGNASYVGISGTAGLNIYSAGAYSIQNFLIEGCRFIFMTGNVIQGDTLKNAEVRRCVFLNSYSGGTGHSQGMYMSVVDGAVLSENIFDHNGWYSQAGSGGIGEATIFNHSIYTTSMKNFSITKNIFMRSSSMNNKFTAEHGEASADTIEVKDNLYVDGEIGIGIGGNDTGPLRYKDITVSGNVITNMNMTRPTNRTLAYGIELQDWDGGTVTGNYVINSDESNSFAIAHIGTSRNVTIDNNIISGFKNLDHGLMINGTRGSDVSNFVFSNNKIQIPELARYTITSDYDTTGKWTFSANKYYSDRSNGARFRLGGINLTDAQWTTTTGDNSTFEEVLFLNPARSVETYMASIGETPTLDAFYAKCQMQDRYGWDTKFIAEPVNAHIKAGFVIISFRADVDNSSTITTTDALLTLRNSLGLSMNGTAWQVSATTGDVNCDGDSNSTDALLILRYSLGLSMSETGWCE